MIRIRLSHNAHVRFCIVGTLLTLGTTAVSQVRNVLQDKQYLFGVVWE